MPETPERLTALEVNYANLDRRGADHERNDAERFERSFKFVQGMKEEILEGIDEVKSQVSALRDKVDTLWDEKNKREGAFDLGKIAAGAVGGILVAAVEYFKR